MSNENEITRLEKLISDNQAIVEYLKTQDNIRKLEILFTPDAPTPTSKKQKPTEAAYSKYRKLPLVEERQFYSDQTIRYARKLHRQGKNAKEIHLLTGISLHYVDSIIYYQARLDV